MSFLQVREAKKISKFIREWGTRYLNVKRLMMSCSLYFLKNMRGDLLERALRIIHATRTPRFVGALPLIQLPQPVD